MLKSSLSHAVELDGRTYGLRGPEIEQIEDIKDLSGARLLVTDMQEGISHIMTVEAPVKYAELVVQRKLQESGEFKEPVNIITHWKKKRGKNLTEIFFTAVPIHMARYYFERLREREETLLVFPLYSVLFEVLTQLRFTEPVGVVFQHHRFAELLIGTPKQMYYANRCVAFDTSAEQIQTLWETVRSEIKTAEDDHRIKVEKIFSLNWIDSGPAPQWPADTDSELYAVKEEPLFFQEEERAISFSNAVRNQVGLKSASPAIERFFYYTRSWASYLNMIFLLGFIVLTGAYFQYNRKADQLKTNIAVLEHQTSKLRSQARLKSVPANYADTLRFLKDLDRTSRTPSYKQVVNDISDAVFPDLTLEVLKLDYSADEVQLEIFGKVDSPFAQAHPDYQRFLDILKRRGYTVREHRFDTEIKSSTILVKLARRIG